MFAFKTQPSYRYYEVGEGNKICLGYLQFVLQYEYLLI